jgi:hypothetical protein
MAMRFFVVRISCSLMEEKVWEIRGQILQRMTSGDDSWRYVKPSLLRKKLRASYLTLLKSVSYTLEYLKFGDFFTWTVKRLLTIGQLRPILLFQ